MPVSVSTAHEDFLKLNENLKVEQKRLNVTFVRKMKDVELKDSVSLPHRITNTFHAPTMVVVIREPLFLFIKMEIS